LTDVEVMSEDDVSPFEP